MSTPLKENSHVKQVQVEVHRYDEHHPYPVVIELPERASDFVRCDRETIQDCLDTAGALLIRCADVEETSLLQHYIDSVDFSLSDYIDQHTPRTSISTGIYTSTEYPAQLQVPFHNENSKNREWPLEIAFYCHTPSRSGETLLADSAAVLQSLDPGLVQRFARHGVRYVRNYREGLGVTWQRAFGVSSYDDLDRVCHENGYSVRARGKVVTVSHTRPALMPHWRTGQMLWFNQAQLFHPSALDSKVRSQLGVFGPESEFPSYVTLGDGEPILDAEIGEISAAFERHAVGVRWHRGDLLIIDNMQLAHARNSFEGQRKVLVSMGRSCCGIVRPEAVL